ncbi:MAG: trypsin-like peptidase domain-containing protein [Acidobacteria bacterium]|nr:trypsin-like peptidase domain-containing protein [Acidobacteriota bacterium]
MKNLLSISTLSLVLLLSSNTQAETPQRNQKPQPAVNTTRTSETKETNTLPTAMMVLNVADIVEKVNPAVVNVQSPSPDGLSLGSGFFIDEKGLVITNFHVIREAVKGGGDIMVVTTDSSRYSASVKGYDEATDIALLEIKISDKKPLIARLGDSDKIRVGEWAIAVGSPYGLDHSVTLGIISAKSRGGLDGEYDDYLQTDAAINLGNSGGPLINTSGEVIGINTLIIAKGQGLGFAIPVNILKEIMPQLRDYGRVRRSHLAIDIIDISLGAIKGLDLPSGVKGVVVTKVERETPAARAGLRRDDVILSVNNSDISSVGQFNRFISRLVPGTQVEIRILREKKEFTIKAELIEKKEGEKEASDFRVIRP